jgi:hypothetical protein
MQLCEMSLQVLDAWLAADDKADAAQAALAERAGRFAPPLDSTLAGIKLKRAQVKALQAFRDLYVCVRSEAARYGPDRHAS